MVFLRLPPVPEYCYTELRCAMRSTTPRLAPAQTDPALEPRIPAGLSAVMSAATASLQG